ncbi:hypothetical protein C0991_012175 [Blastosporella zonata]|nr:hypothetical protein C0991_012175 [Blastosporella zonata]
MAPPQSEPVTPPVPQRSTPTTSSTSSPSQEADQAFADFMSCLTPPPSDDLEAFQPSFNQYGSLESILSAPNSNTFSLPSSSSSSPSIPPSPSHQPSLHRSRIYPRRTIQPYTAVNRRKKIKEKPIYTRRQVDDMLSAVSNCFAGTMEEVLKRVDPTPKADEKTPNIVKDPDSNHELRKILSDTLPRLFHGLQNFLEERITTRD